MTAFVGLDLAWGAKNASGVCVLRLDEGELRLETPTTLHFRQADEIVAALDPLGDDVVAAIDAPLVVANESGRRPCEQTLSKAFARQLCATHSTNLARISGGHVGPPLVAALQRGGFSIDGELPRHARGRFAFEMYPHAFHVVWFCLDQRLPYKLKSKKNQPWRAESDFLLAQMAIYRDLLSQLLEQIGVSPRTLAALPTLSAPMAGRARKDLEDRLDAVSCAAAAFLAWNCGLTPQDRYGDAATGYIAVPGLNRDPRFAASQSP